MSGLRSLLACADPATWVGRIIGLFLLAFFGWLTWQVLPLLIGDLLTLHGGIR